MIERDDGSAAAEPAEGFAEGQVDVERDGAGLLANGFENGLSVNLGRKLQSRWVAGVARPRLIVFFNQGEKLGV